MAEIDVWLQECMYHWLKQSWKAWHINPTLTLNHFNCAYDDSLFTKINRKLHADKTALNKMLFPVATETVQDTNMLIKQFQTALGIFISS